MKRTRRGARPTQSKPSTARALVLAAVLAGATVSAYFFVLKGLRPRGGDHPAFFILVAIGAWASFVHPVPVRNRNYSVSIALSEIPALVAIVFMSPGLAIAAVSAGHLAASVQRRLQPVKILLNWTVYIASLAAGIYAYDKMIGRTGPTSALGWAVALGSVTVINLINIVLLLSVMAVVDERWRRPSLGPIFLQTALAAVISALGGLVAVCLIHVNSWGVVLFVGIAGAAVIGYWQAAMAASRYNKLERVYEFTRKLSSFLDASEVIERVLDEARTLLSVGHAELVVPVAAMGAGVGAMGSHQIALHCTLDGDGPAEIEPQTEVSRLDALAFERGSMLFAEGQKEQQDLAEALGYHGLREGLVAPLQREDPKAGYLLVADRAFRHEGFGEADLRLLEALAANAGVSLRSSRLLQHFRLEAEVRQHQAQHDALTSLPNRSLLSERLEEALTPSPAAGNGGTGRVAMLLVDLDGFKEVNDTLGHQTGDAILVEVARRLAPLGRGADTVARLGGDEFAILMPSAPSEEAIAAKADEVLALISQPLAVEGLLLDVRASLGVAVSAVHSHDTTSLLRHADIAMYAAKRSGGGACFYDKATDRSTLRRLTLATELRRAIELEDLDVWYQPVVELSSGQVVSCEALLRWNHDQFGPISPSEFIPVAESAGLIDQLTWWVLDMALSQARAWRELVVPDLRIAVNFSARSLMNIDIAERLGEVLERSGMEPGSLTLELTETSAMADPQGSLRALERLRNLGISLSIDDYGTGFSSLSRLKHLPFHELKIDRSFVKEMTYDKGDEAIVRSTIELARNLGRTVTAEGVEDQATLYHLERLGCNAAQGFYLARPLPAHLCEAWLVSSAAGWGHTSVRRIDVVGRSERAGDTVARRPASTEGA